MTGRERALTQLRNLQPVRLGAVPDRFLAAGHRLGNALERHALAGEKVQLLDLVAGPGLPVPLEPFRHLPSPETKRAALERPPSLTCPLPPSGGGFLVIGL